MILMKTLTHERPLLFASDDYACYRPGYPASFFDYLNGLLPIKQNAWDCGTENGQVARELAQIFEAFYAEVRRTVRKGALLCLLGYGRPKISESVDACITDFYENTIGDYWDPERHFIDNHYQTLPFPFPEIKTPAFENVLRWNLSQLLGYLNTWSAVKHFVKKNGFNPVKQLKSALEKHWPAEEVKEVCFPLLLRIGSIKEAREL